ncbi:Rossmann-like domain-containing protein [Sediminispirochaeta bajacaliforniensis]|uniref:Rossmann-like domain-containing protein n=1 Tax=Sediminispirochaeta bajacaliforniensis TaxID=148 RepID=UPI000366199F|nr:DUF364 domain-containing protein [Sediminispirochaeta bajacaliforniensis]
MGTITDRNIETFYHKLQERFSSLVESEGIARDPVRITARGLSPDEAIGRTRRKDFPILTGKEILLQAQYRDAYGQAFTDSPSAFEGTLEDVLDLDLTGDSHARGLFIASLNAVMRSLGRAEGTVHCKDDGPERCGDEFAQRIKAFHADDRVALIGFQPALLEHLAPVCRLRVLDLNSANIGSVRHGVTIEDGIGDFERVVEWADFILCTGSTLANGSIVRFLDLAKPVVFFGTTIAGTAELFGLKRWCFCSM